MTAGVTRRGPARVYAIADVEALGRGRVEPAVAEMAAAGVTTIQLRAKRLADDELYRLAEALCRRLSGWPGALWIDDRADLAAMLPFAGVHLGQRDLPPAAARAVLPGDRAIGWSTHRPAETAAGDADAAVDWVAIGPVYATASKERPDPVIGLDGVREARRRTGKPLVAIGGIDADRLPAVLAAGADSAAVLSAVAVGDVAASCRRLLRAAGAGA